MSSVPAVYEAFRGRLGAFGQVVVAGGSVRDHVMGRTAKDFDVFVLGPVTDDQVAAVSGALSGLEIVTPPEFHKSEPYLVATVRLEGELVQIMCNPAADIEALLDSFDWNVSLFAFDGTVRQREMVENIAIGRSLRLQTVTFPLSTLRRGFRFSERFGMVFERADIVRLCRDVAKLKTQEAGSELPSN